MDCTEQNQAQQPSGTEELLSFVATGNALPVLHEIKHALNRFAESGETAIIDLGAIPFAPGDERVLDDVLGQGEVRCTVDAMGESTVTETRFPGVWRVDHFDEKGDITSRFIEVTDIPELLKSQPEDIETGREALAERLEAFTDGNG